MYTTIKNVFLTFMILSLSACISTEEFNNLKAQNAQLKAQHEKAEQDLASTKTMQEDLEKRLGMTNTQKTELQKALDEVNLRKKESEKRIQEYQALTKKFKNLVDAGKLKVKTVKGRMIVALQTDILFPSGSANLSKAGIAAIKEVSPLLVSLKDRTFQIEGHTDNVPIKTADFASNWELASARALTVLKTMTAAGMPAARMSAASFGDTKPVAANDTPDNRKLNRRIDIVVVPDLSALPGYEELNKMGAE